MNFGTGGTRVYLSLLPNVFCLLPHLNFVLFYVIYLFMDDSKKIGTWFQKSELVSELSIPLQVLAKSCKGQDMYVFFLETPLTFSMKKNCSF